MHNKGMLCLVGNILRSRDLDDFQINEEKRKCCLNVVPEEEGEREETSIDSYEDK